MKKKVTLAFDMDDTLCLTGEYINLGLNFVAQRVNKPELAEFVRVNKDHISTMLYPPEIKKYVDNFIIGPGDYMLDAKPSELMETNIIQRLASRYKDHEVTLVVCSHRGFHQYGEIYTRVWLDKYGVAHHFDEIHMLDGKVYPNKMDFLKKTYPDSHIVLVDDNPLHDFTKEHEKVEGIVIYDWVHQFPGYKHQDRYNSMTQFFHRIDTLLGIA